MNKVIINREPVELFNGLVLVNNDIETRKSKKMYAGDVIEFAEQKYLLELE